MQISDDVMGVLNRAVAEGNALKLPAEQLPRPLYQQVDKVLGLAGGKWDRRAKAHLFTGAASDAIDDILLTGRVTDQRAEFGFFETPPAIVELVMDLAEIESDHDVLEPSAGCGALAFPAAKLARTVDCFELHQDRVKGLAASGFRNMTVEQVDFLMVAPDPSYQRIIMNPPFARQQDARHILHAMQFLDEDGGRLVSVASAAVKFRDTELYRQLRGVGGITIEDLPEGSFKVSGTSVNTVLIVIDR